VKKFKFIDLFAGIGGMRIPFEEIGGDCVFSSEIDKHAQQTYKDNFNEQPYGDIKEIEAKNIPNHDLLLAGFPCQAFSHAGLKKGFNDTRGTLFFEIARILEHHRPKALFIRKC
jgi:DNA (cytosine-5)-methyltransferase 1